VASQHRSTGEVTVSPLHTSAARSPEVPLGTLDDDHLAELEARALDAWRDAELQVHAWWDAYRVADRGSRRAAFVSYVALDAEAAAAHALAQSHLDLAAAA
jgi:hypothetical protein